MVIIHTSSGLVDDELPEVMELQMPDVSGSPVGGEDGVPDEVLLVLDPDELEAPELLEDEGAFDVGGAVLLPVE